MLKLLRLTVAIVVLAVVGVLVYSLTPKPRTHLIFIGDSLTYGLGAPPDKSMPALIERALQQDDFSYQVINAGIPGSYMRSAAPRVAHWIQQPFTIAAFVIALGGMDVNRTDYDTLGEELEAAVKLALGNNSRVLLVAFNVPFEIKGAKHSERFAQMYRNVAEKYQLPLVPDLLANIHGRPELYQVDKEHPNETGLEQMARNVYPAVHTLLARQNQRGASHSLLKSK